MGRVYIMNSECVIVTTTTTTVVTTTTTAPVTTTTTTQDWSECTQCPPGYEAVAQGCIQYDEVAATYSGTTYTVVKKTADASYSVYGGLLFSSWNYNGTGTFTRFGNSPLNTYWMNAPYPSSTGVMNRTSVWASTTTNNQDIGFSVCVQIDIPKTYYIGFGCDNYGKIKLNGTFILEQDVAALKAMFGSLGMSSPYDNGVPFKYWYVYPVELLQGQNVIEVMGHNVESVAGVGIEIYDATPDEIMNATSDADLSGKFIFRSHNLVGQTLYYEYSTAGGFHGYSCAEGYALDTCGGTVMCVKRDFIPCQGATTSTTTAAVITTTTTIAITTTTTIVATTTTTATVSTTTTTSAEQAALLACLDSSKIFETTITDFTPVAAQPLVQRYSVEEDNNYIYFLMTDSEANDYLYARLVRYSKSGGTVTSVKISTQNNYYGDNHKTGNIFITSTGALLFTIETLPGNNNHNGPVQIFRWDDPSDLDTYTSTIIGNNSTERLAYPLIYELNGNVIILCRRYSGTPPHQVYYKSSDDGQSFGSMFEWLNYADSSWWMYYHIMGNVLPHENKVIIGIRPLDNNYGAAAVKYLALLKTDFDHFYKLDGTDLGTTVTRAELESALVYGTITEDNNVYTPSPTKIFGNELWSVFVIGTSSGGITTFTNLRIVKTDINTGLSTYGDLLPITPSYWINPIYEMCGVKYIQVVNNGDIEYYKINNDLTISLIYTKEGSFTNYVDFSNINEINIDYDTSTKLIRAFRFDTPAQPIYITTTTTTAATTTTTTTEPFATTTTTTTSSNVDLITGLISVYEFDETSGTTAEDSYVTNDGTVVNAVVNQTGKIGKCYSYDGSGDYVDFNTRLISGFPFSLSVWINGTNLSANYHVFASNREITSHCGMSVLAANNAINVQYGDNLGSGSANRLTHYYNTTLNNNTWYHLVISASNRTSSGTKVYINGSQISFTSSSGTATTTSFASGESRIAQTMTTVTSNMWAGLIDQFALWNKTLTQDEINALYNSGNGLAYSSW